MKQSIIALLKSLMAIIAYLLGAQLILSLMLFLFRDSPGHAQMILTGVGMAVGGGGAIFVLRKILDHKSICSLGYDWMDRGKGKCYGKDILWGGLLGIALIAAGTAFLILIGSVNVTGTSFLPKQITGMLLMYAGVAIGEETCFRGYILSNLMDSMNKYVALALSAVLFSVPHLFNPNPSIMSFLGIFMAGLLLGAAYIYTRNLWFPIGIHFTWNFTQAMAGFNVSGTETPTYLILDYQKYDIINGGEFGFEASLVCIIILAVATAGIIYHFTKKKTA